MDGFVVHESYQRVGLSVQTIMLRSTCEFVRWRCMDGRDVRTRSEAGMVLKDLDRSSVGQPCFV